MSDLLGGAYSWSKIDAYATCPFQYYEEKVLKKWKQPDSEQIIWGNLVHKAAEDYVGSGGEVPLPDSMATYKPTIDKLLYAPGDKFVEMKMAIDGNMNAVEFFDDSAELRGIGDITIVNHSKALAGDYKTGKVKPNSRQLDLQALFTFCNFPEVEECNTLFFWLKFPKQKPNPKKFFRSQVNELHDAFMVNVHEIEWSYKHNAWPAKPNGLCKDWCQVLNCPYNGRHKLWKAKQPK